MMERKRAAKPDTHLMNPADRSNLVIRLSNLALMVQEGEDDVPAILKELDSIRQMISALEGELQFREHRLSALGRLSAEPLLRMAFVDVLVSVAGAAARPSADQHDAPNTTLDPKELQFLAMFAVDHATSTVVGAPNLTKPIIAEFYARLWHSDFDRTGYLSRAAAYADAVAIPHNNGPGWQVGKAFAECCGRPGDFSTINQGYNVFMASYRAISEFILKASDPDSPMPHDSDPGTA